MHPLDISLVSLYTGQDIFNYTIFSSQIQWVFAPEVIIPSVTTKPSQGFCFNRDFRHMTCRPEKLYKE